MISGMQAALSGLQAFSTKVEKNANNIANMNTAGFKKDRVVLSAQSPGGVRAETARVETQGPLVTETTNQGISIEEMSNVDLGEEIPDLMLNVHGYTANLKTIQSVDEMVRSLLDVQA